MPKSLLEQLPEIVARGRQTAEKILESLEGRHRVGLQTREWVLPAKDSKASVALRSSCDIKTRIFRRLFVENPRNSLLLLWFSP